MPPKPRYQLRCAQFCQDNRGAYRYGEVWVHIHGQTLWVCRPCAELLGKHLAGIPTTSERRAAARRAEREAQTSFLEDQPDV